MSRQFSIVHAHCYQPPREDPWLEVVEAEPSAAPDHDWNARIDRECYGRLGGAETRQRDARAAARDPDARAGLARIVNLYGWCSFDVGATLCEWLDTEAPHTLQAMVRGDAASVSRWGHGNAIAAPYHHVILPLASARDRDTEIRWGIKDFTRRFGRAPEGMWLPECAVDEDTLDAVARAGIRFTILAPYQLRTTQDTHGMPVRWRGAGNRELAIVPYDGSLAGEVAFGGLLQNPAALAAEWRPCVRRMQETTSRPRPCTTLATDGETFGHHHRNGDVTLTEALLRIVQRRDNPNARLINAAALVAQCPPQLDATLVSPSAWSCAHGIERWRSNCGCRLDASKAPAQQWRAPLREALTELGARCHDAYEREAAAIFTRDPWDVRDAYGSVVAESGAALAEFVQAELRDPRDTAARARAHELLELERATLRMFTSCAWFFDEVERIETRQVLRYAARALELSHMSSRLLPEFMQWLEPARGPQPGSGSASDLFMREALPHREPCMEGSSGGRRVLQRRCTAVAGRAHDTDVAANGDTDAVGWRVTTTHRRTMQSVQLVGTVRGSGPTTVVTLGHPEGEAGAQEDVAIHEFPEAEARMLLRLTALDDAAFATL